MDNHIIWDESRTDSSSSTKSNLDVDFEIDLASHTRSMSTDFSALFPINPDRHIVMESFNSETGAKPSRTVRQPATPGDVERHLNNNERVGTLGYLPGYATETTVACVDVDNKSKGIRKLEEAFLLETNSIQTALEKNGVAFNLEISTNGGHHLWVFLSEPVPYKLLSSVLKAIAAEAGYTGVEVYPMSENLGGRMVYLPYRGATIDPKGLGNTFLQRTDGTPISLIQALDQVRLTRAETILDLAHRINARVPAMAAEVSAADLDPAGFELLKKAALTTPESYGRHDSAEAFLNVAERMSRGSEMAEFLKSETVFSVWITDGSRTLASWAAEIDRWLQGKSTHQYGITQLRDQGWQMPDLPKLGRPAGQFRSKQSWQRNLEALRLKYAPFTNVQGDKRRIRRYRAHEVRNIPPLQPLVGNLLVKQTLAALLGPSGAGKSMIGLDLSLHVATGQDWQEHKVSQGPVVWLAAESMEYTANRLEAWCNMHVVAPESLPFDLLDGYLSLTDVEPDGGLEELILTLKESEGERGPLALIVVDTVARTFGDGDENSNDDMKHFTDAAELLTRIFNATVLLIHHTGKDASRGGRGASAFKAPLTTELVIEKKGGLVKLSQSKNRGAAEEGKPILLSFQSHSWEENGVERSAGVVARDAVASGVIMGRDLLTPQQTTIFEVLEGLYADVEAPIKRTDWKQACAEHDVAPRRFNEGLKSLLESGAVREVIQGKTFEPVEAED
ncbi:hypothetical protein GCM10022631_22210 [Deinococcus rubellus]|uniref:Helicase RepA family protein n=1 Tax=Deinococcus rubellus TaxID=1889240 RepID=A0ABY5YJ48_9DEIO|nr:helicase RepA family protein [Deinococcus rubellus]UWX64284.1 helicase RepA family protein [Deinococcus rubellus]